MSFLSLLLLSDNELLLPAILFFLILANLRLFCASTNSRYAFSFSISSSSSFWRSSSFIFLTSLSFFWHASISACCLLISNSATDFLNDLLLLLLQLCELLLDMDWDLTFGERFWKLLLNSVLITFSWFEKGFWSSSWWFTGYVKGNCVSRAFSKEFPLMYVEIWRLNLTTRSFFLFKMKFHVNENLFGWIWQLY